MRKFTATLAMVTYVVIGGTSPLSPKWFRPIAKSKIDESAGKITLKHGLINDIGWTP